MPEPISGAPSPEALASFAEIKQVLERSIDALPLVYRQAFVLRAVEGLSVAETSEALGVSEETVRTRQFRARARLQTQLTLWFEAAETEAFLFHAPRCDRVVHAVLQRLEKRR